MSEQETVSIEHQRFGRVEIPAAEVLHFDGLPGFPDAQRFALLRHDRESTFLWLVSLDRGDLSFVVTDPRQFFPDYAPKLGAPQLASVSATEESQIELLSIATIRDGAATLNLAAPVLVHAAEGRGVQLILDHGNHSTREALPKV